ncbi:hypothetical protein WDU94_002540, partial [Cyamophila willieti]
MENSKNTGILNTGVPDHVYSKGAYNMDMENSKNTGILNTRVPDHAGLIIDDRKEIMSLTENAVQNEVLDWTCFVCNVQLTTESSNSVFYTMLPKSDVLLSNSLNKVLKTSYVAPHTMRSPVVCIDCFNVFDDLEVAEEQCRKLRRELVSNFTKTCALYDQLVEHVDGIACQTDGYTHTDTGASIGNTSEDDTPLSQLSVQIKQEVPHTTTSPSPKVKKLKVKVKKKKKRDRKGEPNRIHSTNPKVLEGKVLTDLTELENKHSVDEDVENESDNSADFTVKPDPDLVSDVVLTNQKK